MSSRSVTSGTFSNGIPAVAARPFADTAALTVAGHIIELDGLRGVAALAAVYFHYMMGPATQHAVVRHAQLLLAVSPIAVDMFFVISGFLIGSILLRYRDSPHYYRTFYIRRLCRIIPLYYLWIALYFVFFFFAEGWGITRPAGYSTPLILLSLLLLFQNFLPAIMADAPHISPTWTLAVEEHFYLLCPLLVRKLSLARLVHVLLIVVLVSPILRAVISFWMRANHGAEMAAFSTICRADALALGVLIATFWASPNWRRLIEARGSTFGWAAAAFTAAGTVVTCLPVAGVRNTLTLSDAFGHTLAELSSASLFLVVLTRPQSWIGALLRSAPLQRLGRLSYCLYLVHWGVLWILYRFILDTRFGQHPWLGFAMAPIAFAISIGLAELSWKYLESPLIRLGRRASY